MEQSWFYLKWSLTLSLWAIFEGLPVWQASIAIHLPDEEINISFYWSVCDMKVSQVKTQNRFNIQKDTCSIYDSICVFTKYIDLFHSNRKTQKSTPKVCMEFLALSVPARLGSIFHRRPVLRVAGAASAWLGSRGKSTTTAIRRRNPDAFMAIWMYDFTGHLYLHVYENAVQICLNVRV